MMSQKKNLTAWLFLFIWIYCPAAAGSGDGLISLDPDSWREGAMVQIKVTGYRPLPLRDHRRSYEGVDYSMEGRVGPVLETASGGRLYQIKSAEPGMGLVLHAGLNGNYGLLWNNDDSFHIRTDWRHYESPSTKQAHDFYLQRASNNYVRYDWANGHERYAGLEPRPALPSRADGAEPADRVLDFLYMYDTTLSGFYSWGWGIPDLAVAELAYLNAALTWSGVPLSAELAQLEPFDRSAVIWLDKYGTRKGSNYDKNQTGGNYYEPLYRSLLENAYEQMGIFSDLQTKVDSLGVDIVSLNFPDPGQEWFFGGGVSDFCGIAPIQDPGTADLRVHVNACTNSLNLAHLTGHNLGLNHESTYPPNYPLHAWPFVQRGGRILSLPASETTHTTALSGLPLASARGVTRAAQDISTPSSYQHVALNTFSTVMGSYYNSRPQFSDPGIRCSDRLLCGAPGDSEGADAAESLRRHAAGPATRGRPGRRLLTTSLPLSRFVLTGEPYTAFMAVLNPNQTEGSNCAIAHHGLYREKFSFRAINLDGTAAGEVNQPVNIPGGGVQTFIVSLAIEQWELRGHQNLPYADRVQLAPYASCDNVPLARARYGLNTIGIGSNSGDSDPDFVPTVDNTDRGASNIIIEPEYNPRLLALTATLGRDGIVDVPAEGTGVFAVSMLNHGKAGRVTVSVRSLSPDLPARGQICQTDRAGACMEPRADSVTLDVAAGAESTFGIFVQTDHATPFDILRRFQFEAAVMYDKYSDTGLTSAVSFSEISRRHIRATATVAIRNLGSLAAPRAEDGRAQARDRKAFGSLATLASGWHDRYEVTGHPAQGTLSLNEKTGTWDYRHTGDADSQRDSFTYRAGNAEGWSEVQTVLIDIDAQLPLLRTPEVQENDVEGDFWVDLDDYADPSVKIDRFVLTRPPPGEYAFDEYTGVLNITLPAEPGVISWGFAAENSYGQSAETEGRIDVLPWDDCAPESLDARRWARRMLPHMVRSGDKLSLDEEAIREMCLKVSAGEDRHYNRYAGHDFRSSQGKIKIELVPFDYNYTNSRISRRSIRSVRLAEEGTDTEPAEETIAAFIFSGEYRDRRKKVQFTFCKKSWSEAPVVCNIKNYRQ